MYLPHREVNKNVHCMRTDVSRLAKIFSLLSSFPQPHPCAAGCRVAQLWKPTGRWCSGDRGWSEGWVPSFYRCLSVCAAYNRLASIPRDVDYLSVIAQVSRILD
jgi:hypothetical protein